MSKKAKLENIINIKTQLADKYTQKSKIAGSKTKKQHYQNKAADYIVQAKRADIKLKKLG